MLPSSGSKWLPWLHLEPCQHVPSSDCESSLFLFEPSLRPLTLNLPCDLWTCPFPCFSHPSFQVLAFPFCPTFFFKSEVQVKMASPPSPHLLSQVLFSWLIVSETVSLLYSIYCNLLLVYILNVPHSITWAEFLFCFLCCSWTHPQDIHNRDQDGNICAHQILQWICRLPVNKVRETPRRASSELFTFDVPLFCALCTARWS